MLYQQLEEHYRNNLENIFLFPYPHCSSPVLPRDSWWLNSFKAHVTATPKLTNCPQKGSRECTDFVPLPPVPAQRAGLIPCPKASHKRSAKIHHGAKLPPGAAGQLLADCEQQQELRVKDDRRGWNGCGGGCDQFWGGG